LLPWGGREWEYKKRKGDWEKKASLINSQRDLVCKQKQQKGGFFLFVKTRRGGGRGERSRRGERKVKPSVPASPPKIHQSVKEMKPFRI